MPHPTKKQRRECHERDEGAAEADDVFLASFDDLSVDVLPNILGFLTLKDVMSKRRINKKTREAVKKTIVPLTDFCVYSVERYNTMTVMNEALPNLQQITLGSLGYRHKFSDGEDPNEGRAAETADWTTLDIEIISNFRQLKVLDIDFGFNSISQILNGRYPFLFNSFPLLEKLSIEYCYNLKWDLEMLAGMPLLKELKCCNDYDNECVTGNINSLRVLKDTLEKVTIRSCNLVEGNFMDLADFPHLKELYLQRTAVTGDIRDMGENDFSSLERLRLPNGVYGGWDYEFQRISDGPDVVRALYLFNKQRPELEYYCYGKLSEDSLDWYETVGEDGDTPPFYIHIIEAGSRLGYRWETEYERPCEVNWLDPEPDRESGDYAKYIEELQQINAQVGLYRGFHQPPTEEEYNRLFED